MLTMNYKDLQYRYTRPKKGKKESQLVNEHYSLKKSDFSASTWKDYKDWLKEQKLKEKLLERSKKKKPKHSKPKVKKATTRKEKYQSELKDNRWKELSLRVMKRDGYKCMLCGSKHNLNVHHMEYEKGKKAWEYSTAVLITLCKDCHQKVHADKNHELNPYRKIQDI